MANLQVKFCLDAIANNCPKLILTQLGNASEFRRTSQAARWNLGASLPELLAVARRATQEYYVEVALENLKDIWGSLAYF